MSSLRALPSYTGRPILITPEGKRLKMGKWNSPILSVRRGFQCLGHSNWTICSRLCQLCSLKFQKFSLLYWKANTYYPRERKAENGKIEFSQPECEKGFSVPWAFKLEHLQQIKPTLLPKFSKIFTFILGGQFLLPQREDG